jgi:heme/copper-type cytochrome/quinol oxidase subunit 2
MPISVKAVSEDDFKAWVEQEKKSADAGQPDGRRMLAAADVTAAAGDEHGIQR